MTAAPSPSSARVVALELLRWAYLREVEALAERLRPRLESGQLVPWSTSDDRWEDLTVWPMRGRHAPPTHRLEAVCLRTLARTFSDACGVLAVTPAIAALDTGYNVTQVREAAAELIARDVLRVARERGWIPPAA